MSKSSIGWRKAGISSLATAALVASACVAGASAANATTNFQLNRLSGTNRYGTSAAVAKKFTSATNAILASGLPGHYPDALTANYLAGTENAPVLLTNLDTTPPVVLQALKDLGVKNITIVGGTGVISQAQQDALAKDYNVTRISGKNRFETATDVINSGGTAKSNEGIVATGLNFPDALGAGPLAYADGMPLAISKTDSISQDEIDALKAAGVTKVLIVGGTAAVSPAVQAELEANGITVDKRLSGTNRSATAEAVANYEIQNGFTKDAVNVASGFAQGDGADALGGGALSGANKTPMLITMDDVHPGAATLDYLTKNANTLASGWLFGGTAAVSDKAKAEMESAAQQVTSNQSYSVTPSDSASLQADGTHARSYTVTGLDDSKTYNVAVFEASNVDTSSAQITFADANKDGVADQGSPNATITSVNNQAVNGGTETQVTPVNGVVKFDINSSAPDDVIPVVWLDNSTGTAHALDLNKDNTPAEQFGIGGETVYTPQAASNGDALAAAQVIANDETANTFTADKTANTPASERTFSYDSNDTFYVGGNTAADQVSMATFEKDLNAGDLITTTFYHSDPALSTTWQLTDQAPSTPTNVAVAQTKGSESSSLTVTWDGSTIGSPDGYNVYRLNQGAGSNGFPGSYTKVGSVDGSTTKFVDSGLKANTQYDYVVTAVEQGEESSPSTDAQGTTAAAPATTPYPATTGTSPAAAPESGAGNQANDAIVFNDSAAGVSGGAATYATKLSDIATTSSGQVTLLPYTLGTVVSATGATPATANDTVAIFNSGTAAAPVYHYIDLSTETPGVGAAAGHAYGGVTVTNPGGTISVDGDGNTTSTDNIYITLATQDSSGTWSKAAPTTDTFTVTTADGSTTKGAVAPGTYYLKITRQ